MKGTGIFQFLLTFHQRFRIYHTTPAQTDTKRLRMAVGQRGARSVRQVEETRNKRASLGSRQIRRPIRVRSGCLGIRGRSSTLTVKGGW